jgi:hypothetical protein
MPTSDDPCRRAQRERWQRHDAHLWLRHDAWRFVKAGRDPADVYPVLALKRERERQAQAAAEAREFAAAIEQSRRVLAWCRAELAEVKADMARRKAARQEESKYSPSQPRVPAGNPRGGQWTDRSGGQGQGQSQDQNQGTGLALPMGNVDIGDVSGSSELGDLFQIAPGGVEPRGVQLAGDIPDGSGNDQGVPSADAPEIPQEKPKTSAERTGFMRAAADWLARNTGLAGDIYTGAINNVEWLQDRRAVIQAGRDPAKTFEELQEGVGARRPGYDDHHIVEQTLAERLGFTQSEIDDPSNVVSVPRLRHYEITGWYGTRSPEFGGLSPREYLIDKGWDERRRIGLRALVEFKVLKP